ncbi:S8 family serine peptidase [Saccharothrix sp. NPDC042600]|uniref:S8 family serine peptidase n=1 Tax=Saccharothrix TaxID=2071 RepID=UPI0033C84344|nr:serine protease [Saccharothrix mutabilis subsp. capreolus]
MGSGTPGSRLGKVARLLTAAALSALVVNGEADAHPSSPRQAAGGADSPRRIDNSYIVVLDDSLAGPVDGHVVRLTARHGGRAKSTFRHALRGFSAELTDAQAQRMAADPGVAHVQPNSVVRATAVQTPTGSWGIDRSDQRGRPLDNTYGYRTTASNVNAYVLDTGVRLTHTDFGGRAVTGFDAITAGGTATDCNGHGTHVAGTLGGTTYGMAKGVRLHSVRVLACNGEGSDASVLAGLDWVVRNAVRPAVVNMSLGGDPSTAMDSAVRRVVAAGIPVVVAAGNGDANLNPVDACAESPARVAEAIVVTGTDSGDARISWVNTGGCVDLFAPGRSIVSAADATDTATRTLSGTSMAAPHVAGAVALHLAGNTTATSAQVRDAIVSAATPGIVTNPGAGTPNWLLYSSPTGSATGGDRILRGETLLPGQQKTSANGAYRLTLQTDGNLVLYNAQNQALWHTVTWGTDVTRAILQTDGNFVLYSTAGVARWHTHTWGTAGDRFIVQSDSNVVLYGHGNPYFWHRW